MLRKWFVYFHGEGAVHQYDLYRCMTCRRLITWRQIREGRTCCIGRMVPSTPKASEVLRLFLLPWTF